MDSDKLKKFFLDLVVDEKGKRVSYRKVWYSDEFLDKAGFSRRKNGDNVSPGNIWYWVNKKWKLTQEEIFDYHKNVTGRIGNDVKFDEWAFESIISRDSTKHMGIYLSELDYETARQTINDLIELTGDKGVYYCGIYSELEPYMDLLKLSKRYRKKTDLFNKEFREYYTKNKKRWVVR